jgi:hypothetical protein
MAPLPPQLRALNTAFRKGSASSRASAAPSMILYAGLACLAFLKDLLDLALVGSLPGIGSVVTLCFSFLIWILMFVFDRSGGRSNNKTARSLTLLGFSMVESFGFGLNFLPIQTATVIVLYVMTRSAWKKEEIRAKKEEAARNQENQTRAYRIQAQVAQYAQEAEAANDPVYNEKEVRRAA